MADRVLAVTRADGIAGRREDVPEWASEHTFAAHQRSPAFRDYQRALFGLLACPSEMEVHRGLRTVIPEPSGPPDPRSAD